MDVEQKIASSSSPWVEKYRPVKISDVAHQTEVVAALQQAADRGGGNLPHLLFYGPPGTGKTSLALALVRQLFPRELLKQRVLELNASDERGIRIVREKIKVFAQGAVSQPKGKEVPPFKVIILDEADAVTGEAQTALRRTMETFSKVTRFILICNYVSRIIAPLASRCAKFRFQPLPLDASLERLQMVCEKEGFQVNDAVLKSIVLGANGDLRRTLMVLQSAVRMVKNGEQVGPTEVALATGEVPQDVVSSFRAAMRADSTFGQVRSAVERVVQGGYPADQLLQQLCDVIVAEGYDEMSELQKSALLIKLAQTGSRLADGASERLQLLDAAARGLVIARNRDNNSVLFGC